MGAFGPDAGSIAAGGYLTTRSTRAGGNADRPAGGRTSGLSSDGCPLGTVPT